MNFVSCAGRSQREREGIKAPGAMRNLCNSVGVNVCQMQGTHWALRDLEVNLRKSVSQYNRSPPRLCVTSLPRPPRVSSTSPFLQGFYALHAG